MTPKKTKRLAKRRGVDVVELRVRVRDARQSLKSAQDECERRRGEANWYNGFRAGANKGNDDDLYGKEKAWWKSYESADETRSRALSRLLLAHATLIRANR